MAHIAYILGQFPVLSETFIGNEMRAIEALGHRITPIALHPPDGPYQTADEALAVRTQYFFAIEPEQAAALMQRHKHAMPALENFASAQTSEPPEVLKVHAAHVAEIITEQGCTHIHAHFAWGATAYAIAAAKLLNMPISFTCHGSDVYARPKDLPLKCAAASMVFAAAPTMRDDVQAYAPKTPCHTVYCGVETALFKPVADTSQRHARWLYTGRLIDCKGVDDVLAAWVELPPDKRPQLDIVGEGPEKETLERYARQNDLTSHVTFFGSKDAQWLAQHGPQYRAFIAAFRQGLDGSKDTAPLALKEAMAMGLPIVTTDFVDIPKIAGDAALYCQPGNSAAIARAVRELDTMRAEKRANMGQEARERAQQQFSVTRQALRMLKLWGIGDAS